MQVFGDVKAIQVTPGKEEVFKTLLPELVNQLHASEGCMFVQALKRSHTNDPLQNLPRLLIRAVKSVNFYLYCEFNTLAEYDQANRKLFADFQKRFMKLLISPPDIACGKSY